MSAVSRDFDKKHFRSLEVIRVVIAKTRHREYIHDEPEIRMVRDAGNGGRAFALVIGSKKIQLFNGALDCRFLKFELYSGSKKNKDE
jgi:hypothetical protein